MPNIKQNLLTTFVIIVAFVILGAGGYLYFQYNETKKELEQIKQDPQAAIVSELINKVARLVVLPENEKPTIATISDINKLEDQPFFKNAKNGDKILIYTESKRTILYRPSEDKVIETLTLSVENIAELKEPIVPNEAGAATIAEPIKESENTSPISLSITILNGTKTPGMATKIASSINESTKDKYILTEVIKADANNIYPETILYANTEKGQKELQSLQDITGYRNSNFQTDTEKTSSSDIIIVVGEDLITEEIQE